MKEEFKILLYLLICTFNSSFDLLSQQNVNIIAHRDDSTIRIRWAPGNPAIWEKGIKYGYKIEKYEISTLATDSSQHEIKKIKINEGNAFSQSNMEVWSQLCDHENKSVERYASIAAQAIFGSTFNLDNTVSSKVTKIHNLVVEQENRYSFAMFSSDQCWAVANASGLAYLDREIDQSKNYFYRIYLNLQNDLNNVNDTGYVFVKHHTNYKLPKPSHFHVDFQEHIAVINWNYKNQEHIYNSFILERSIDGKEFNQLNESPIVPIEIQHGKNKLMYLYDSLLNTKDSIFYRLKGRTPFGIDGPFSEILSGISTSIICESPEIYDLSEQRNTVSIKWQIEEKNVKKFILFRSSSIDGDYKIISDSVHRTHRDYIDPYPGFSNYYIVMAEDNYGNQISSLPKFIQLNDTIAPSPPKKLQVNIDTTGKVFLNWIGNPEHDILGYRIFRSNFRNHEYSQITSSPVMDTLYFLKINLRTLTDSIYFKLQATDNRYNNSSFSSVVAITKPDKVSPVTPSFTSIVNSKSGIFLQWNISSSDDVINQLLYRKAQKDSVWILIAEFENNTNSYNDTIAGNDIYTYTVVAKDEAENESNPAKPVMGQRLINSDVINIVNLEAIAERENARIALKWICDNIGTEKYLIYRAENEDPLSWYATVNGEKKIFYDNNVIIGNSYRYGIRAQAFGIKSGLRKNESIIF